jgi:addiction module RelE/StbE family toxin
MWLIEEHRRVDRQLSSVPREVLKRHGKWQDIASISGPAGLRRITGFHDEALAGQWRGYRSSRLNLQYRVIYRVSESQQLIRVESVTAHDYRRTGR